jgi:hypothetical protein
MSLRPILKHVDSPQHRNQAVHFPPSASLTRTFVAYSSTTYDRSPIIVTPNSCALPERGCPGRTYGVNDSPTPPNRHLPGPSACLPQHGRDYHPRALALGSMAHHDDHVSHALNSDYMQRTQNFPPPPQLVPDTSSSESDESDASAHTLTDHRFSTSYPASSCLPISDTGLSIPNAHSNTSIPYASYKAHNSPAQLSFLPHPLSHPSQHQYTSSEEETATRPLRSRPRRRERSRDRDRIRGGDYDFDEPIDPLPFRPPPSPPRTSFSSYSAGNRKTTPHKSASPTGPFSFQDSGCLDGF